MKYIRITSYRGKELLAEHLYLTDSQVKAIERFRKEYPEHADCVVVAQDYESDDPKNKEHFRACLNCGCVH